MKAKSFSLLSLFVLLLLGCAVWSNTDCYPFCDTQYLQYPYHNSNPFGNPVAVDNNTVAVGDSFYPNTSAALGAVYVYKQTTSSSAFSLAQVLGPGPRTSEFGNAVAVTGVNVAVGAYYDDQNKLANSGSVYVYTLQSSGKYSETQMLTGSYANANFGAAVAMTRTAYVPVLLAVGINNADGSFHGGVNVYSASTSGGTFVLASSLSCIGFGYVQYGNPLFFSHMVSGKTNYLFAGATLSGKEGATRVYATKTVNGSNFALVQTLNVTSDKSSPSSKYGNAVAYLDATSTLVVGAYKSSVSVYEGGMVYLYSNTGSASGHFSLLQTIVGPSSSAAQFGSSVTIEDNHLVIGAHGVNNNAGAALVYTKYGSAPYALEETIEGDFTNQYFGSFVRITGTGSYLAIASINITGSSAGVDIFKLYPYSNPPTAAPSPAPTRAPTSASPTLSSPTSLSAVQTIYGCSYVKFSSDPSNYTLTLELALLNITNAPILTTKNFGSSFDVSAAPVTARRLGLLVTSSRKLNAETDSIVLRYDISSTNPTVTYDALASSLKTNVDDGTFDVVLSAYAKLHGAVGLVGAKSGPVLVTNKLESASSTSASRPGLTGGAIAGIVIGCIVFISLCAGGIYKLVSSRGNKPLSTSSSNIEATSRHSHHDDIPTPVTPTLTSFNPVHR